METDKAKEKGKIGEIVRRNINMCMAEQNLSMRCLSGKIGMSESYMQKVLNGKYEPSLSVLQDIAMNLNTPLESLLVENQKRSQRELEICARVCALSDEYLKHIESALDLCEIAENKPK